MEEDIIRTSSSKKKKKRQTEESVQHSTFHLLEISPFNVRVAEALPTLPLLVTKQVQFPACLSVAFPFTTDFVSASADVIRVCTNELPFSVHCKVAELGQGSTLHATEKSFSSMGTDGETVTVVDAEQNEII